MTAKKVTGGQVVSMEYTLRVDGKVVDTSEGAEPLQYLHGAANIVPGLEREIEGMALGESKTIIVEPIEGYGETDEEAFVDVPRSEFPDDMPLKPGVEMQLTTPEGEPMYARIESVEAQIVHLNLNHPLAGAELHFDVKVVALRDATEEELDHGHAHGDHSH